MRPDWKALPEDDAAYAEGWRYWAEWNGPLGPEDMHGQLSTRGLSPVSDGPTDGGPPVIRWTISEEAPDPNAATRNGQVGRYLAKLA